MVRVLEPREAQTLLAGGEVDIVDVRDSRDWAAGHIPGSRSVPLELLKADTKTALTRNGILFVCARGMRSLSAAQLAESAGFTEVASLDGGMMAWVRSGFALETSPEPAPPCSAKAPIEPHPTRPADGGSGPPEPELDAVIGANLSALRTSRNLSLDNLARLTGLSRTLLGQIERGTTQPSVGVIWKLARAFDVRFSALLASPSRSGIHVLRAADAKRLVSQDGRFSSRALFPLGAKTETELYELYLGPHSREDAQPHAPGTRENLVVSSGRLELHVDGTTFELTRGDAIVFHADVPHSYVNPDKEPCYMYLVMTYPSQLPSARETS